MTRLLVSVSMTIYRVLLWRFPKELRARYGPEMLALFAEDLRERARKRGVVGVLGGWRKAVVDLVRPLPRSLATESTRGIDPKSACRANTGRFREKVVRSFLGWSEDLAFAWRSIRRDPGFLATGAAVLGAGIALNTAVFGIVNAYLVRPLPYPEPDRLVNVRSPVDVTWDDADEVFEKRVSWDLDAFTIVGEQGPQMVLGAWVTPDFFDVYGVRPALGRVFTRAESVPGGPSVALIGYGLWQERYGGANNVLGKDFQAYTSDRPEEAEAFTIVGVLPPDFWHFNDYTEILAPLREDRTLYSGRLASGLPASQAAELLTNRVIARSTGVPADFAVEVTRTHDAHVASIRPTLLALQTAVILVLVIASANVAVLLLVRSARREREFGVRRALGAGQGRLGRQLLFEGGILAALAGGLGLGLGWLILRGISTMSALALWRSVPGGADAIRLDLTVIGVTIGLCTVTGVVFGVVPLLAAGRRELSACLADGGRAGTDTVGRRRVRGIMVGTELAVSLALLTGAGLMVQSAINLQNRDLGFDADLVLRGQVGLRQASYPTPTSRLTFFETLLSRIEDLLEVESVGMVSAAPFTWRFGPRGVEAEGGPTGEGIPQLADAAYFTAMRIPVVGGRGFDADDALGSPEVTVISETLASELWPGQDPIGRRLRLMQSRADDPQAPEEPWVTVVGVVRDVQKGVGVSEAGDIYAPYSQAAPFWMNLMIRRHPAAPRVRSKVDAILAELDPDVPFSTVGELSDAVDSATAPSRFLAVLFTAFAALALLLSVVGLYGVMAYAARQARKDVAIRMALGADARAVTRFFLRNTGGVLLGGLAVGVGLARVLGFVMSDQLHGIEPGDPATVFGVAGLLCVTALAAVWLPVRQATGLHPMTVLREE